MRKLFALALIASALARRVAVYSLERPAPASACGGGTAETSATGALHMRKLLALTLIALALAGGVAVYSLERPAPAAACESGNC